MSRQLSSDELGRAALRGSQLRVPEVEDEDIASFVAGIVSLMLEGFIEYQAFSRFPDPGLIAYTDPATQRNRQAEVASEPDICGAAVGDERSAGL